MGILLCSLLLVAAPACGDDSTGGGGGGGTPTGCLPSENTDAVDDSCGVFVSSSLGDDLSAGTKDKPVKTLNEALARATDEGTRVYACAEEFAEAIEVPAGMAIFGGLDCANGWAWIGATTKATVAGPADEIAVTLRGGEGTVAASAAPVASGGGIMPVVSGGGSWRGPSPC